MGAIGLVLRLPPACAPATPHPACGDGFQRSPSIRKLRRGFFSGVRCAVGEGPALKTCKQCKKQFDPNRNHPRACRFHTAHFGGETKRKFEGVYTGGTMNTPDSGHVFQYWHCCGSEDPFDAGCTAAPHCSYDD